LTTPRRRGFSAERELARLLWSRGFAVVRGPASGARGRHVVYPDLVAIYQGNIYVFEVKYRHSLPIYIQKEQINRLLEFARRAAGEPYIAVKLPRRGWYIVPVENAVETRNGYKISEEILESAQKLEAFINSVINITIDNYIMGGRMGKLSSSPSSPQSDRE